MKLSTIAVDQMNTVPGVFGISPIIRGKPLELGKSRRGARELTQDGRIVAISDTKPQLLSFAAINGLAVTNYTEFREPSLAAPVAFTID